MSSSNRIGAAMRAAAWGLVAIAAAACATEVGGLRPPWASDEASIAGGRRLALRECSGCHATGAEGESRNAAAPPLRALAERYPGSLLVDAFPERMKVGHPAMPEFRLSPSDVDALLSYLLSIQERQGA